MAFNDNPIVDLSSKASEESVLATKQIFMQKHGFIAREENPDKGVDLDVEILVDSQAIGFKFAIQIKSVQKPKVLIKNNKRFIGYTIKTSRLGYLCRRSPGFGLIVLYDEKNQIAYYEYVEEILNAIMLGHHNQDSWKKNETVKFYVPIENTLNKNSASLIYCTMKQRYESFSTMYSLRAKDFNLPTFEIEKYKNPISLLEEYGYILFNNNDYEIIYSIISSMSIKELCANPKLLLLAAITYLNIGQHAEGNFFFEKCNSLNNSYNDSENELLLISKLLSDYSLGKITSQAYYEALKELFPRIKTEFNTVYISLHLLFAELINSSLIEDFDLGDFVKRIHKIAQQVDRLEVQEDLKYHYMIDVASLTCQLGIALFSRFSLKQMVNKTIICDLSFDERFANANLIMTLVGEPMGLLKQVYEFSEKTQNDYLKAVVLFKKSFMFYGFMLNSLSTSLINRGGLERFKENFPNNLFEQMYNDLTVAYNIMHKKNNLNLAHRCLLLSLEANYLYRVINSRDIDEVRHTKILEIIESLRKELGLEPNKLVTEAMIVDLMSRKKDDPRLYEDMSEDEKRKMSEYIAMTLGLPPERAPNVMAEVNFMQRARAVINTNYFDILVDLKHKNSMETLYREPPKFIVRCKKCAFHTVESDDLDVLLACMREQHGYVCF